MRIDPGPDRILGSCLGDNMEALNAHLPRKRKRLNELLRENHPHVNCGDGSTHTFNKKEGSSLFHVGSLNSSLPPMR
jgi:uncharacterized protein (UPF0216 family)